MSRWSRISPRVRRRKLSLLSPCRLVSLGESLKSYDVFKIDIDISISDRDYLWTIESAGVCNIMIWGLFKLIVYGFLLYMAVMFTVIWILI